MMVEKTSSHLFDPIAVGEFSLREIRRVLGNEKYVVYEVRF